MDTLKLKIEQGEYSLGQIVVPQNFTKTSIKDGKMITEEVSISGRKFPLKDIRKNLLIRHTRYMCLTTDEEFANVELNYVQKKKKNLGKFSDNNETLEELLIKLKKNGTYPLFCIFVRRFNNWKPQSPSDNCKCFI